MHCVPWVVGREHDYGGVQHINVREVQEVVNEVMGKTEMYLSSFRQDTTVRMLSSNCSFPITNAATKPRHWGAGTARVPFGF